MKNDTSVTYRRATRDDAPHISAGIIEAVGEEITLGFAGSEERVALVRRLFTELAADEASQYSYRNTIVAEADGRVAGIIISYDGADLHTMRRRFIEKARETLGYDIREEEMADETSPDEIYLDSLCVFEPFRRHGIGAGLISEAVKAHEKSGKPVGLLVDKDNLRARRLYEGLGFEQVGERPFAGTMMDHLQRR